MDDTRMKRRRLIRKYPAYSLADCMIIPRIIFSENAGLPLSRILLAKKIGTSANSSSFTTKLAACEEYGVTEGRYKDETIQITNLGTAIAASRDKTEYFEALSTALNKPEIFEKLNALIGNASMPEEELLRNIAIRDLGVHQDQTAEFLEIVQENRKLFPDNPKSITTDNSSEKLVVKLAAVRTAPDDEQVPTIATRKILIMAVEEYSEIALNLETHFSKLNLQTILVNPLSQQSILKEYKKTQIICSIVVPTHNGSNQDIENIYALGLAEASTIGHTLFLGYTAFSETGYSNPTLVCISDDDHNLLFIKLLEFLVDKGVADIKLHAR